MPIETLDLDGFLEFLKRKQGRQSDRQFARQLGVSPSYLSDVYNRRTVPGEAITAPLGAQRTMMFQVAASAEQTDARTKKKEKP
jgi:transcriptional regulator with XRE-family HTH domain